MYTLYKSAQEQESYYDWSLHGSNIATSVYIFYLNHILFRTHPLYSFTGLHGTSSSHRGHNLLFYGTRTLTGDQPITDREIVPGQAVHKPSVGRIVLQNMHSIGIRPAINRNTSGQGCTQSGTNNHWERERECVKTHSQPVFDWLSTATRPVALRPRPGTNNHWERESVKTHSRPVFDWLLTGSRSGDLHP